MTLSEQEEQFLAVALEKRLLDRAQADAARRVASSSTRRKPVSFVLLELGTLDADAVDLVLSELLELADREVEGAVRLARSRQVTAGIRRLEKAVAACPSNEKARWKRAEALTIGRRYEEAAAEYTALLDLTGSPAAALNGRGVARSRLGALDEAIADQEAAIEHDPEFAKAHFDLGACRHARRELDRAIACYDRALSIDPDYVEALNNRAIASLMRGDLEGARASWLRALEIDGRRKTIRHNLKILLAKIASLGR